MPCVETPRPLLSDDGSRSKSLSPSSIPHCNSQVKTIAPASSRSPAHQPLSWPARALAAIVLSALALARADLPAGEGLPPQPWFVFSTDMSGDVDDAAAVGFLIEAVERGQGKLAACVSDSPTLYTAPALRAMLDAWSHTSVPVGAYQGGAGHPAEGPYTQAVAEAFGQAGKTRADFEDDVTVLRRAYAAAPDRSVVFIAVGFLTSLEGLLRSAGDSVSPLSGAALFERKTAHVVSLGDNFIGNDEGELRWNWKHAPEAAAYVINHMTRPFYWFPANEFDQRGFPKDHPRARWPATVTGPEGLGWKAAENPIQLAFERTRDGHPGLLEDGLRRKAFDPAATRFATDFDTRLAGFYHRRVHLEIQDGRCRLDPERKGWFTVLKLALPAPDHIARDYLDHILARLRQPE